MSCSKLKVGFGMKALLDIHSCPRKVLSCPHRVFTVTHRKTTSLISCIHFRCRRCDLDLEHIHKLPPTMQSQILNVWSITSILCYPILFIHNFMDGRYCLPEMSYVAEWNFLKTENTDLSLNIDCFSERSNCKIQLRRYNTNTKINLGSVFVVIWGQVRTRGSQHSSRSQITSSASSVAAKISLPLPNQSASSECAR